MPKLAFLRLFAVVALLSAATSAVLAAGLPSPAAASTAGWSSGTLIDPSGSSLESVSCPTASFCVAVDDAGNALTYDGSSWSSPEAIDASSSLSSVSCPTASFCAAVDQVGRALTYNGSSWSPPNSIDTGNTPTSVSCPTASFCVAVDWKGNAFTYNGSSWSPPKSIDAGNILESVSCPSVNFCAAVGQNGYALTYNGSSWSLPESIDAGYWPVSVSCPTVSFCAAVDSWGHVLTYNGSSWSSPESIDPGNDLWSISCPSASFCAAVDLSGNALTYNGSSWSSPESIDPGNDLEFISCPTAHFCVAVDYIGYAFVYSTTTSTTTTTITSVTSSPVVGQPISVGVEVTGPSTTSGSLTPSGQVSVSDGTQSCEATLSGSNGIATGTCSITEQAAGNYSLTASYPGDANFTSSMTSASTSLTVGKATPTTPSISNLPASGTFGGGFTASVSTTGDGATSVTSNSTGVCTVSGLVVTYVGVGTCSLTAHVAAGTDYAAADGSAQSFSVGKATPTTPSISNLPASGTFGGGFTASVSTTGDGATSVTSNSTGVCTVSGLVVTYVGVGTCSLTAHVAAGTDYAAADGSAQSFSVGKATPTTPSISNLPASGTFGGGFTASVSTTGDGATSVTSNSTGVCTVSGLVVTYVGVGTCSLTAHVAAGTDYAAADGSAQSFSVGKATPTTPSISNLPASGARGGGFTASVSTTGDGATSVTSNSTGVCTVSGLVVTYVGVGTCSLTAHVAAGTDYAAADGSAQSFSVGKATPTTPSISNLPASGTFGGGFTASVSTTGDGATSVTSNSTGVCTVSGLVVTYVGVGTCSLTAHVAAGTDYAAADGSAQSFSVGKATPTTPSISNLPASGTFGGGFTASVSTTGDGATSVTSNSTGVCTVSGLVVTYVGVGTCSLTAHVAAGTDYAAADGSAQSFSVGKASQTITFTVPSSGTVNGSASLSPTASSGLTVTLSVDGTTTNDACSISGDTVSYLHAGSCVIDANQAGDADYLAATQVQQTITVGQATTTSSTGSPPVPTHVAKATTRTALKLSARKVTYGHEQTEHLSVTVSSQYSGSMPTGTVTVKASTRTLCVIRLSSGKGSCRLSAKWLKVGTYHLIATYGGSTNFKGSTSAKETLRVVR